MPSHRKDIDKITEYKKSPVFFQTFPFAHGGSSHSRKAAPPEPRLDGRARTALEVECRRHASLDPDLRFIVIGHHHVAIDEPLTSVCRLIILGDWTKKHTYAVFRRPLSATEIIS